MNRYDLVLFDFDGTLMNTAEGIKGSVSHTLRTFGLGDPDDSELDGYIGPPFNRLMEQNYGLTGDRVWEVTDFYRNHYATVNLTKAAAYEGIYDVIREIRARGMKTAVATYKREDYAHAICEHFGFTQQMDAVEGCDRRGSLTKTDIIRTCIEKCGSGDLSRILMVGDTLSDAEGAREAGIPFLGVLYGFGLRTEEEREKSGAVGFAETPAEITEYL